MVTDSAVIQMNEDEALDKWSAFEKSRRRDAETQAATEIYGLLAIGRKLVDIGVAIREAGFDDKMRPRLAIARADRRQVRFTWYPDRDFGDFYTARDPRGRYQPTLNERVNFNRRHGRQSAGGYGVDVRGWALVPMIPADISLEGYPPAQLHILWEVEAWADQPILAEPPHDPYLIRRIRGDLFEVLAEWDLTEVERYVMAGRARVQ